MEQAFGLVFWYSRISAQDRIPEKDPLSALSALLNLSTLKPSGLSILCKVLL